MSDAPQVRFRHNVAVGFAGIAGFVAAIPLVGTRWYLTPLLLIPLLVAVWGWRSGVDVDSGGVTVRALFGARRLPWREITGFTTQGRRAYVLLAGERAVALPAVAADDLPALIEAGGQHLDAAAPDPGAEEQDAEPDRPAEPDPAEPDPGAEPEHGGGSQAGTAQ